MTQVAEVDGAAAKADADLAAERTRLEEQLVQVEAQCVRADEVYAEAQAAEQAIWPAGQAEDPTPEQYNEWAAVAETTAAASRAVLQAYALASKTKQQLAVLGDPAEREARVAAARAEEHRRHLRQQAQPAPVPREPRTRTVYPGTEPLLAAMAANEPAWKAYQVALAEDDAAGVEANRAAYQAYRRAYRQYGVAAKLAQAEQEKFLAAAAGGA